MNILFVMETRINAGSIQAVGSYTKIARKLGHKVAVYGNKLLGFSNIFFTKKINSYNYVIFIFESNLDWINKLQLTKILSTFDRSKRIILDADGMYNKPICIDGYDYNHSDDLSYKKWKNYYHSITDYVIQPSIIKSMKKNVFSIPFYGYESSSRIKQSMNKKYDLVYVGHNWWRWDIMKNVVLPNILACKDKINTTCFIGHWWDKPPSWAKECDFEGPFKMDVKKFKELKIKTKSAVEYSKVIKTMSQGNINIMTQRPLLRHFKHVTSKYFEIFLADTIPLVVLDKEHSQEIYGSDGKNIIINEKTNRNKIREVLQESNRYKNIINNIRYHLSKNHSYDMRLGELIYILKGLK